MYCARNRRRMMMGLSNKNRALIEISSIPVGQLATKFGLSVATILKIQEKFGYNGEYEKSKR